jgi:hypothetical protein
MEEAVRKWETLDSGLEGSLPGFPPLRPGKSIVMARFPPQSALASLAAVAAAAVMLEACAITPRTGRPADNWKTTQEFQKTVDCVLAQLNRDMAKGKPPNFTNSVKVVTPGKVEEIIPQEIPSGTGELYVVRFSAEDDGSTNVVLYSTLSGLDKRVEKAMTPCLQGAVKSTVKGMKSKPNKGQ